jgi:GMP synthase (glutamine-hydrolysing)
MKSIRILVVQTGTTEPNVVALYGDYEEWFCNAFSSEQCSVIRPFKGDDLPNPGDYDGVVLTGSPKSVRDEEPWMKPLGLWALAAADRGVHVLAVCFGHQLVGEALGGRVDLNPSGPERGTVTVALCDEGVEDPLFMELPSYLTVQATHCDALLELESGEEVIRLAGNANTAWQAFRYGDYLRAVQFHPELNHDALSDLMEVRGVENCVIRPTTQGTKILRNWANLLG